MLLAPSTYAGITYKLTADNRQRVYNLGWSFQNNQIATPISVEHPCNGRNQR
jgi:hypothetical protein